MPLDNPLSWAQVAALALHAHFPPGPAAVAVSITEPESGRIVNNVQQGQPYATTGWGLWQITPGNSEPQFGTDDQMLIGINNARAAHAKWSAAGGFSPWTTWSHSLNVPYLPAAEAAVAAVSKLPLSQLLRLVDSASQPGQGNPWTPDAALQRFDAQLKRFLAQQIRQEVNHRMAIVRLGNKGWLP